MELLRIGVVGCGAIGREHIDRITNRLSGGKVVAVSDLFVEGAHKVGEPLGATVYSNSADLVNDPDVDAVICTTPGFAHQETVMQALEAGKPIFCEKPLTTSAEESLEIVEAEMAGGKKLVQVGFMRRFDQSYQQVKEMLDSGEFGAPLYLKCTHWNPSVDDNYDTEMAVTDTAIHEIDILHWLVNDDYESAQVMMPRQTSDKHPELKDPQLMFLRCKSGLIAMIEVFVNCKFGYDINCQIVCENGVIDLPKPSFPTYRKAGGMTTPIEQSWKKRFIQAYDVEIQDWIDATRKGEVHGPDAWDGLIANLTADALVASQKTGEIVPIQAGERPEFYK
ncbi:MAG: Gfo/Idh/MocA family oxidoreductase [Eubacteriales bacterium]|nr:Gfo/Idh/MocA family oxidoreductase [Eubacteriales bacterium]